MRKIHHALIACCFLSLAGQATTFTGVMLWYFERSGGSALYQVLVVSLQFGPAAIAGLTMGGLLDRLPKMALVLAAEGTRALLVTGALAGILWEVSWLPLVSLGMASGIGALGDAALMSVLPSIFADSQERLRAIASLTTASQVGFVAGPAAAGALAARIGLYHFAFASIGAFIGSGIAAAWLAVRLRSAFSEDQPSSAQPSSRSNGDRRGSYITSNWASLSLLVASGLLLAMAAGGSNTLMLPFITSELGRQSYEIAWVSAVSALSQVIMGATIIALARRLDAALVLSLALIVMAAASWVSATATVLPVLIVGVVVTALANAPANIGAVALRQALVSERAIGGVTSRINSLNSACLLGGVLVAGAVLETVGARAGLIIVAVAATSALILGLMGGAMSRKKTGDPAEPSAKA